MLRNLKNTNKQGNVGVGKAISYFSSVQYSVSIPLNDTQKYDLIVDVDDSLKKIQVKTSYNQSEYGGYSIDLSTTYKDRHEDFDRSLVDLLFVLVEDGRMFLIPADQIDGQQKVVVGGQKYNDFEIHTGRSFL